MTVNRNMCALMHDLHTIGAHVIGGKSSEKGRVCLLQEFECDVRKDDTPPIRCVGAVLLEHADLPLGSPLLHEVGQKQASRATAYDIYLHLTSSTTLLLVWLPRLPATSS